MKIVTPIYELAQRAAELAEAGYPVFPCDLNKQPMEGSHGHLDATDHADKACALFLANPNARLIGVRMGVQTMLVCIDVDPNGVPWLQTNWHRLGDTLIHRTPRGGAHLIYKMPRPPCPIITCRQVCGGQRLLSEGVDIKGEGGYIIWAGPGYSVVNNMPPADMPIWMKNRLIREPKQSQEKRPMQLPRGVKALEGALATVENTKIGERNNLLFWAACRAGELIKQGILSEREAIRACVASGKNAGLPEIEAWRSTKSGIETGKRS